MSAVWLAVALLAVPACSDDEPACDGVVCGAEETCDDGTCTCGGHECPDGFLCCADRCVNAQFDPDDCGGCGHACAAEQACTDGACN